MADASRLSEVELIHFNSQTVGDAGLAQLVGLP
jgi:hypothetical protein